VIKILVNSYIHFIRQQWPLLTFGFLTVFIGNVGQSFFLSWFGADIQRSLAMSADDYGFIYAIATLSSSTIIFIVGDIVDRWSLSRTITIVALLLAASCFLMSQVRTSWMLFFSFWGLRLAGQGLFPHIAQTTMIRSYTYQRGKALSLSSSGVAFGEMVLPLTLMLMITFLGWRTSWIGLSIIVLVVYLPCALWLLGRSQRYFEELKIADKKMSVKHSRGRKEVIKDWRFWSVIPTVLAAPFIVTGIFIQQHYLLDQKSWPASILASSFVAYGFLHWVSSMMAGSLVDRYQAKRLLPFLPLPLITGLLVLATLNQLWAAPLFMILLGFGMGASSPIIGSLWAEMYGTQHIGAIRSMITSMMIFSTAASPWLFGLLIELGWSASKLFGFLAIGTVGILLLLLPAYRSFRAEQSA
jgi:MFS family permease